MQFVNGYPTREKPSSIQNKFELNPNLFEGDMRFPNMPPSTRGVLRRGDSVPWTNGIVPYEIASGYEQREISTIISTMQKMERLIAINNVKCIQFRPRIPSDQYFITIRNGDGCSSYVGQNTGLNMERTVTLEHSECIREGTIMHELLHTLGFHHEQSRPDRDNYIRINYTNIQSDMEYNFEKYNSSYVDTQNTPYDYASVMHYSSSAFSSNGYPTIEPLQSGVQIGQRGDMSSIDIQEVRLVYKCSSTGNTFPSLSTTTTIATAKKRTTIKTIIKNLSTTTQSNVFGIIFLFSLNRFIFN